MTVSRYTIFGLGIGLSVCFVTAIIGLLWTAALPIIVAFWLVLGVVGGLLSFLLDNSIREIADVLSIVPLPVAGWIENHPSAEQTGEILPGIRRVINNVRTWLPGSARQIVITSGDASDGKSLLASGLAMSLAESGLRVVLVDANCQSPSLHKTFSLPAAPGLAEHLMAPSSIRARSIIYSVKDNLQVVPVGAGTVSPVDFRQETFRKLISYLSDSSDVIIFDCMAASESSAALALLDSDVHLLAVVRMRHTYVQSLRQLASQLCSRDMATGGLVFFGASNSAMASATSA